MQPPSASRAHYSVESDLPSTLDNSTIYAITDSGETEIEKLIIRGMEFVGGGAAPGTPRLVSPSQSQISNGIDIGNTTSGVATYSLNIKAKDITQSLLVEWGNGSTGYSFDTSNLPSGVMVNNFTGQLQISVAAATSVNGVDIVIVYTGSDTDEDAEGTLGISSSSVDGINVEVTLVANKVTYVDLAAVKFTGSQWVETGVDIGPNTSMKLDMRILNEYGATRDHYHIFSVSNSGFALNTGLVTQATTLFFWIQGVSIMHDFGSGLYTRGVVDYTNGSVSFLGETFTAATKTSVSTNLAIGKKNDGTAFNFYYLEVYGLEIYESGVLTHKFLPKRLKNIVGLYDTETGNFITSGTSTPLVAVETNN